MDFRLSLGDYLALAGLALAAVGTVYLITEAKAEATATRLEATIQVAQANSNNHYTDLKGEFEAFRDEVKAIVTDGLTARSDEVILAMSKIADYESQLTVHVSNMDFNGDAYRAFRRLGNQFGDETKVYRVMNVVHGSVDIASMDAPIAIGIQEMMDGLGEEEKQKVSVRFDLKPSKLAAGRKFTERLIRNDISRLERRLKDLEDG